MHIDSLETLFAEEMKDIYSAEQQAIKAMPEMIKMASSADLRAALEDHLKVSKNHVTRLEQVLKTYDESPEGKDCAGMAGILEEVKEMMRHDMEPDVKDAALISAMQRIEHYEMAVYGSLRTFARVLGDAHSTQLLQQTLEEEGKADRQLTQLAEWDINAKAMSGIGESD